MSKSIRIRMYNVGFGDCFLVSLPDQKTILVDAGFHSQGKGAFGGNDLVDQIIADVKELTGRSRIDVIIATHRHQDHVYAFNSDKWDAVEIGEVWLPWLEDRGNPQAVKLWKKKHAFALQLQAALPTFQLSPDDTTSVNFMLWNAGLEPPGFAAAGGWSNAQALDRLHEGFERRDRARPRFLPEKKTFPETFETPVLPGVRVHVLGPARDPDLIEHLDPTRDGETYRALALRAAGVGGLAGSQEALAPFGVPWRVESSEPGPTLDDAEIERLNDLARGVDAVFAAEKVDGMINSTSLVLVLEFGKAKMLLPGDAEWGTWKRILDDPDARALVRGATFFKVGHHGSHNATAKSLVEDVLPKKIPAMISTQEGDGSYRNNIPLPKLLTALKDRDIRFARSDKIKGALPKGFDKGDGAKWVDLRIPC